MRTTKSHVMVTDRGQALFTVKANLTVQGKSECVDISLPANELARLFHLLQQKQHEQEAEAKRQHAEHLEKRANVLVNDLDQCPAFQQVSHVVNHVALPIIKRWFVNRSQHRSRPDESK